MIGDTVLAAMATRGVAAGGEAVAAAGARIAAVAEALPGVTVQFEDNVVTLIGPGLIARALGTRRVAADPRFAALVQGATP